MRDLILERIQDSIRVKTGLLENEELIQTVEALGRTIAAAVRKGNQLILCGNGGSASDALHFAGEVVGKFQKERDPWPAVVLNSDVAAMTAISNDYGYADVFARQARGLCRPGDVFVGISTSGNSENVINAVTAAKEKGAITAGLLGYDGGKLRDLVDYAIVVPCDVTARVQECHILLIHILCEMMEEMLG